MGVFVPLFYAIRIQSDQEDMEIMMQHEGPMGIMNPQEMQMMNLWEQLNDDQKATIMKRMLDSKIMMKEGMIKQIQFKIETMKLVKGMLEKK
jgi:hypothetical protein